MEAGWGQKWGQSQPSRRVSRSEGTEQRHESEGPNLSRVKARVRGLRTYRLTCDMASHGRPQINLPSQSSAHEETGEEVQRDFELGRVLLKVSSQRERDAVVLVAGVRATPNPN